MFSYIHIIKELHDYCHEEFGITTSRVYLPGRGMMPKIPNILIKMKEEQPFPVRMEFFIDLKRCEIFDQLCSDRYYLALCQYIGCNMQTDQKQAIEIFENLSDNGFAPAQNAFGFHLQFSLRPGERDIPRAFSLYEASAEQKHEPALHNLHYCHKFGLGVAAREFDFPSFLNSIELLSLNCWAETFGYMYHTLYEQKIVNQLVNGCYMCLSLRNFSCFFYDVRMAIQMFDGYCCNPASFFDAVAKVMSPYEYRIYLRKHISLRGVKTRLKKLEQTIFGQQRQSIAGKSKEEQKRIISTFSFDFQTKQITKMSMNFIIQDLQEYIPFDVQNIVLQYLGYPLSLRKKRKRSRKTIPGGRARQ